MPRPKVYHYKVRREPEQRVSLVKAQEIRHAEEDLTGFVNGMSASDLEERFARSLRKSPRIRSFSFRHFLANRVEVDFFVDAGGLLQPVMIDGPFAHRSAAQRAEDQIKTAILNDQLRGQANPVIRIGEENLLYNVHSLTTQEGSDGLVSLMFR